MVITVIYINKRMIKDEIYWSIKRSLEETLESEKHMSYSEIRDFFKTGEGQKMIDNTYKEEIDRIMKGIGDDKVIVEVEHGDGGEGEDGILENEILPNLDCTKSRISLH